jgi:protein phosphatase
MLLTTAAQTDIGLVRNENEDRFLCDAELRLFAVADGIGGLPGGAEAAETAVNALLRDVRSSPAPDLVRAFAAAQSAVLDLSDRLAPDTGLGTTLCATIIHGKILRVANVGDSRAYLFRGGKLLLLTYDDTVENDVIRRRGLGEKIEMQERYRNALTRCIGQPMPLQIEVKEHALEAGDLILVCSDGITRSLPDSLIATHLGVAREPVLTLGALIAASLERGGNDNATGVLFRVGSL